MRFARTLASTVSLSVAFSGAIALVATVVVAPAAVALTGGQLITSYGADNGNSMGQKANLSASGSAYDGGAVVVIRPELDAASIVDVDTFNQGTCVVTDGGAVWCWGYASNNRLGSVPPGGFTQDLVQVVSSGAREVALGYDSMCFTTSTEIKCIGSSTPSGSADPNSTNNPLTTLGHGEMPDGKVSHLTAGVSQYCVINDTDGHGYCWGRNGLDPAGANYSTADHGAILGYGSWEPSHTPKAVKRTTGIGNGRLVDIAINQQHACAINSAGKAFCWGDNAIGELGNGFSGADANGNDTNTEDTWEPVAVRASGELQGVNLVQIDMVDDATCALSDEGEVFCWGNGNRGLLGDMLDTPSVDAVRADLTSVGSRTVTDIVHFGNSNGSFLLVADHEVFCWGPCEYAADSMTRDVDGNSSNGRWSRPSPVRTTSAADMVVGSHSQMIVAGPAWNTLVPGVMSAPHAYPASSGATVYVAAETRSIPVTEYVVTAQPGGKKCTITTADVEGDPLPSCVVTGLTNGTDYTFTVAAKNDAGTSDPSGPSNKVTPKATIPDAPGTPTDVVLLPKSGGFKVNFTPATTGGAPKKYQYQLTVGGPWLDVTGTTSPISISGLTNGTQYSIKIRAINDGGQSSPTDAKTGIPTTITGSPGAPTITAATGGQGSITTQWTGATCSLPCATAAAYYEVQVLTAAGDPVDGATCTGTFGNCTVGGMSMSSWALAAGSYKVKLRGVNAEGPGTWTALFGPVAVTAAPGASVFGTPSAPRNVVVTPGDGSLTITWETPAVTGSSAITGYTVMVAQPGGATCTVTPAKRTCTLEGLTNGTQYRLMILATNATGRGLSVMPDGTPSKSGGGGGGGGAGGGAAGTPSEPSDVNAAAGDGEVEVSWTPPSDPGASKVTSYKVSTDNHGGSTCTGGAKARSCVMDGLKDGSYTITVQAVNAKGTGDAATIDSVVVPGDLGPVRDLKFTMRSAKGEARVTWRKPFYDGGSAIQRYQVKFRVTGTTDWKALSDASTTTAVIKKLTPSETYDIQVAAVTKKDTGPATAISGLIPKLPGAPREVTAVPGDGKVTVSWKEPLSSGTSAVKSYVVKSSVGKARCTAKSDERTCVVSGLENGTRYSFTVRARNSSGFGKPGISKRVIPGKVPGSVLNLTVSISAGGTAKLNWDKPASNGGVPVLGYTVTYQADGQARETVSVKDTQASINGLVSATGYTFTVTAKNVYGNGTTEEVVKTAP